VDLDGFLKRTASGRSSREGVGQVEPAGGRSASVGSSRQEGVGRVESAGGRSANDSLHDVRTRLKISSQ